MKYNNNVFSVSFGVLYDGWVLQEVPSDRQEGFFNTYKRGDYTINVSRSMFYTLLNILDPNQKQVFKGYVKSIKDYRDLKKKLKWT